MHATCVVGSERACTLSSPLVPSVTRNPFPLNKYTNNPPPPPAPFFLISVFDSLLQSSRKVIWFFQSVSHQLRAFSALSLWRGFRSSSPYRSENGDGLPRKKKRSHTLRYVLRNRATDDTYLVILFTLHLREDVDEHGELKPEALESLRQSGGKSRVAPNKDILVGGEAVDEDRDYEEAKRKLGGLDIGKEEVGRKDVGDGGDDDEGVD